MIELVLVALLMATVTYIMNNKICRNLPFIPKLNFWVYFAAFLFIFWIAFR
jgi:hypothetical protein